MLTVDDSVPTSANTNGLLMLGARKLLPDGAVPASNAVDQMPSPEPPAALSAAFRSFCEIWCHWVGTL